MTTAIPAMKSKSNSKITKTNHQQNHRFTNHQQENHQFTNHKQKNHQFQQKVVKIQSLWRGFKVRKEMKKVRQEFNNIVNEIENIDDPAKYYGRDGANDARTTIATETAELERLKDLFISHQNNVMELYQNRLKEIAGANSY